MALQKKIGAPKNNVDPDNVRSDDSFEESPSRLMLTNLNFFAQSNASLCRFPRPSFLFAEIYGGSQSAIPPLRQSQNRRGASGSPQP